MFFKSVKSAIFSTIAVFTLINTCKAQVGREFWFVAPDISQGHGDTAIYFRVSSYDDPATVTISQPANTTFTTVVLNLTANESKSVNLSSYKAKIENTPSDSVLNFGIHIVSSSNITVYYEVDGGGVNKDLFTLKSENALGNHFIIPAQSFWDNTTTFVAHPAKSSFEIVATEDSTYVELTPSQDIDGHLSGVKFGIWLDRGQTYSATAISNLASGHLNGSEITSNKPIAITIVDDSADGISYGYGWCKDLMGDQIVPTTKIGKEYLVLKGFLEHPYFKTNLDDKIFITAVYDNTSIYLDGSATAVATIQKGDQYILSLSASEVYILCDEDVYVTHVTGFGCEVGMAILPPIDCTGLSDVSFTRSSANDFYLLVVLEQGGEGDFTVNGSSTLLSAADFSSVPGTGGKWVRAFKQYSLSQIAINANISISNSTKNFHIGVINGTKTGGCIYGYFSHFGSSIITDSIYHY